LIIAYVKLFARMKKDHDNAEQCLDSIKKIVGSSIRDLANVNFAVSGNLEMALLNHDQSENSYKYIKKALYGLIFPSPSSSSAHRTYAASRRRMMHAGQYPCGSIDFLL
ncbi:MAG: hypothetical protein KKH84_03685, partial [Proteobacteria bacterium]|nr:hypothetical protein [Pseudomonadota bacterium]